MYDPEDYRPLYPFLQSGRIWLNHAATSPLSTRIIEALDRLMRIKSEEKIDDFFNFMQTYRRTKELIGRLLGCTADRIAFAENTSNGLNVLAAGLDWRPGDRIVLNTIEFPSNVYPFLNLARKGVEIDFVKERDGKIFPEDIQKAFTPRTRLLSISFVQFLTGFRADLDALGELCKRHDVILCVDAIQGLGAMPIDVGQSRIDFLSSATHKWLMGIHGLAFIYVAPGLQDRIHQASMGWTSNENFFGDFLNYRIHLDPTARRYETGSLNSFGIEALRVSLETLLGVGIENIRDHLFDLTQLLIDGLRDQGYSLRTPPDPDCRSGIVSVMVPDARSAAENLQKEGITVSAREGSLRLAPHYYNTEGEIRKFLDAVRPGR